MYTALYRAERPEVFEEILGQEHIVKILRHQIAEDTVGHAYLFCGTRGTGKTTTARILAKGVNCTEPSAAGRPCGKCTNCRAISEGNFMDVIEIDAASNNGVENIRELRESVKYPPAIGRKKVYIIDEVHMLSTGAFNALLKTLEEPPENVMFILATTEPQKLPATILSRCLKFDFKRVPLNLIMDGMKRICEERGVAVSENALKLLANCADGSVRDGLSVLDQVLASGEKKIDREDVLEYIGTAGEDFFIELTEKVSLQNVADALLLLDGVLADGKDVRSIMKDWTAYYRNLMITKFIRNPEDLLNMSTENIQKIKAQSDHISLDEINDAIIKLSKAINDARWSTQPRILLELAIVNIATNFVDESPGMKERSRRALQPQQAAQAEVQTQRPQSQPKPEMKGMQAQPQMQAHSVIAREENDRLWHRVFEAGEDEAGSFNLIRNGTVLYHVGEKNFTVLVKTDFAKRFTENKRELIEDIMAQQLGRRLQMVCCLESEIEKQMQQSEAKDGESKEDDRKLAEEASWILGVDIEID